MKALKRALAVVPAMVGGALLAVVLIPGVLGVLLLMCALSLWGEAPPAEVERIEPDYGSKWELVEEAFDGGLSLYRNGGRYTTQASLQTYQVTPGYYLAVVPPELLAEMRSRLPERGWWRTA